MKHGALFRIPASVGALYERTKAKTCGHRPHLHLANL